jgi:hypothetical protein
MYRQLHGIHPTQMETLSLSSLAISRRLLEAHARARLLLQRQIAAAYILQRALNTYLEHRRQLALRIDAMTRRNAAKRVQAWWRRMRLRLRWLRTYRAKCKVVHQRAVEHVKRKWLPAITAGRETRYAALGLYDFRDEVGNYRFVSPERKNTNFESALRPFALDFS